MYIKVTEVKIGGIMLRKVRNLHFTGNVTHEQRM